MAGLPWRDAGLRLSRHYQQRLHAAGEDLRRGEPADHARRRAALQADWAQIAQAQAWAAAALTPGSPPDPERAQLCLDYVIASGAVLGALIPPVLQRGWFESALAAARQLGEAAQERELLYRLALLARHLERIDELEHLAGQLQLLADAAGDALAAGRAWLLLGRAQALGERFELAWASFEACEQRLAAFGPSADLVDCWGGLTSIAFFRGRYAQAFEIGQRQLAAATRLGEWLPIGAAHMALSGVANYLPEHEALALAHADAAVAAGERSGALRLIAHAQVVRGHALRRLGRLDEAALAYQAGLDAPPSTVPPSNQANALLGLGQLAVAGGRRADARVLFERALVLAQSQAAVQGARVCEVSHPLVILHLAEGHVAEARAVLSTYARSAMHLDHPPQRLGLALALANFCLASGHTAWLRELLGYLHAERERLHADAVRELQALVAQAQLSPDPLAAGAAGHWPVPERDGPSLVRAVLEALDGAALAVP